MQRYFWIARETCHTDRRRSSSSSIGAWYRASLTHSHSQRKSGREALLQKQNHASAAFSFLICAFFFFAFGCPVFEWRWWGIWNYRAQRGRGGERERRNNELGRRGECLVFIESRVSGRGFCGCNTPNPFLRCLSGSIVSRFRLKMFPHPAPWGEFWLRDVSEFHFGEEDRFLRLSCNPDFGGTAPKKYKKKAVLHLQSIKITTAPEAERKCTCIYQARLQSYLFFLSIFLSFADLTRYFMHNCSVSSLKCLFVCLFELCEQPLHLSGISSYGPGSHSSIIYS